MTAYCRKKQKIVNEEESDEKQGINRKERWKSEVKQGISERQKRKKDDEKERMNQKNEER